MQSEELQHLTGSEPLTLDEEYQMQETWRDSTDKCTFIVLKKGETCLSIYSNLNYSIPFSLEGIA